MYTAPFIFPGQRFVRWILLFILINQVAMCGQKGPLELPDKSTLRTIQAATGGVRLNDI